jgi:hypothetical protein
MTDLLPPDVPPNAIGLGVLAMKFRRTHDEKVRQEIARAYAEIVNRLIASGGWNEVPAFEDQLPDDWMPDAFFDYWQQRRNAI